MYSVAQNKKQSGFKVTFISSDIKIDQNKLQQKLDTAKSFEAAKAIISSQINSSTGHIVIRFKENEKHYWWRRNFEKQNVELNAEKWIILARRGTDKLIIRQLSDFREKFNKKLILFDTLVINIYISQPNLQIENYVCRISCKDSSENDIAIPFKSSNQLYIFPTLFMNCQKKDNSFKIFNKQIENLSLVNGSITLLNTNLENEFLSVVKSIREIYPDMSIADISNYLESYINLYYGETLGSQLQLWILKKVHK